MTTKPNRKTKSGENEKDSKRRAAIALHPNSTASAVIAEYGKIFGDQDISALITELKDSIEMINAGDMQHCEGMLIAQAYALQSIFANLSRRASSQEYMKHMDGFLRLALKAQNQCRMTLETLSNIKNPPVVYAKQANIANGPQQINNGLPTSAVPTHAEKNQNQPNELLEMNHGERLDARTTSETIGGNKTMAAVDSINRTENGSR